MSEKPYLRLDEGIEILELHLNLLNGLGDEGRRVSLVTADAFYQILQRLFKHDVVATSCWGCAASSQHVFPS